MHSSFDPRNFDYRTQFRQVGFGCDIACLDIDRDGQIVSCLPSVAVVVGYEPPDLVGRNVRELVPRNEVPILERALLAGGSTERVTALKRDGTPVVVSVCLVDTGRDASTRTVIIGAAREIPIESLQQDAATLENIRQYYNKQDYSHDLNFHFGLYDRPDEPFTAASERLLSEFLDNVGSLEGKVVLELGCGLGTAAIRMATHYGCARVEAITISDHQCRLCIEAAERAGVSDRVRFSVRDANELDLGDSRFDVIIAMESIFHMDRARVFRRARRHLKPDGRLALCDVYPFENGIVRTEAGEHTFVSLGQTLRLLRDSGFVDIRFIDWTERSAPSYRNIFWQVIELAKVAHKRNLSVEQTFGMAEKVMRQPLTEELRSELIAEVLAQVRGASKAQPGCGYYFLITR